MKDVIDTALATGAAVLMLGLVLLLNPITIVVMFLINPPVAVLLLISALVLGLLGSLTGAVLGGISKWIS